MSSKFTLHYHSPVAPREDRASRFVGLIAYGSHVATTMTTMPGTLFKSHKPISRAIASARDEHSSVRVHTYYLVVTVYFEVRKAPLGLLLLYVGTLRIVVVVVRHGTCTVTTLPTA